MNPSGISSILFASALFFSAQILSGESGPSSWTKPLWDGVDMPGTKCPMPRSAKLNSDGVTILSNVGIPDIEYRSSKSGVQSGLLIVCPGGGYKILAEDLEGTEIADIFSDADIACMILRYRVPDNPDGALMDIQRAIRYARANAKSLNIDPNKIAVIGFSAGANLCARASTSFSENSYAPVDDIDKLSSRPDATLLIYPAYCDAIGNQIRFEGVNSGNNRSLSIGEQYATAKNLKIDSQTPPAFIVQCQGDTHYVNASIAYYLALKNAKVPANLFLFEGGNHGFGAREKLAKNPMSIEWTRLAVAWLKSKGF